MEDEEEKTHGQEKEEIILVVHAQTRNTQTDTRAHILRIHKT